jgi:hypothetical protein
MRQAVYSLCVAMVAIVGVAGCGGGGGAGAGPLVSCEQLKGWQRGEDVSYRFVEPDEEWLVDVFIADLRPGYMKYTVHEQRVGDAESTNSVRELNWEGDCPAFVVFMGSEREKLIMGDHSAWGSTGAAQDFNNLEEQSCEAAMRSSPAGTFKVRRCLKHGLLGSLEPITDDVYAGEGAAPGGGFVARQVRDAVGREALALVEVWNGL